MEKFMEQPLSTRAQLAMLREGLAGDPEPARRDLGVEPAPFTAERLRPLLEKADRRPPFDIRLLCAHRPARELTHRAAGALGIGVLLVTLAFSLSIPRWTAMFGAMAAALAMSLAFGAVRRRLKPTPIRVLLGLAAAGLLYGLTLAAVAVLSGTWPAWETYARELAGWKSGLPMAYLLCTLPLIVAGEEFLWRGIGTRYAMERLGRAGGIAAAAALYALAHVAAMNPLLVIAAFCCGLLWGWLYASTDNLVAPTVCHLAWDATILFILPIL